MAHCYAKKSHGHKTVHKTALRIGRRPDAANTPIAANTRYRTNRVDAACALPVDNILRRQPVPATIHRFLHAPTQRAIYATAGAAPSIGQPSHRLVFDGRCVVGDTHEKSSGSRRVRRKRSKSKRTNRFVNTSRLLRSIRRSVFAF